MRRASSSHLELSTPSPSPSREPLANIRAPRSVVGYRSPFPNLVHIVGNSQLESHVPCVLCLGVFHGFSVSRERPLVGMQDLHALVVHLQYPLRTSDHISAPFWRSCDCCLSSWAHVSGRRPLSYPLLIRCIVIGIIVRGLTLPGKREFAVTDDVAVIPYPSAFSRLSTLLISALKQSWAIRGYEL